MDSIYLQLVDHSRLPRMVAWVSSIPLCFKVSTTGQMRIDVAGHRRTLWVIHWGPARGCEGCSQDTRGNDPCYVGLAQLPRLKFLDKLMVQAADAPDWDNDAFKSFKRYCEGLLELLLASDIDLASFGRGRLAPTAGGALHPDLQSQLKILKCPTQSDISNHPLHCRICSQHS